MNVLETEWWTLLVPPEWWAENEDHSILIGDRDDVGTIEISTLCRDQGDFSADEAAAVGGSSGLAAGMSWFIARMMRSMLAFMPASSWQ